MGSPDIVLRRIARRLEHESQGGVRHVLENYAFYRPKSLRIVIAEQPDPLYPFHHITDFAERSACMLSRDEIDRYLVALRGVNVRGFATIAVGDLLAMTAFVGGLMFDAGAVAGVSLLLLFLVAVVGMALRDRAARRELRSLLAGTQLTTVPPAICELLDSVEHAGKGERSRAAGKLLWPIAVSLLLTFFLTVLGLESEAAHKLGEAGSRFLERLLEHL